MKYFKRFIVLIIIYLIFSFSNVYAEDLPGRFDLREHIDIEVRNQEETNTCWAFSATSMLSTHLAYLQDEIYTFSPRHLEYTMSEDAFTDNQNKYAYKTKSLDLGGNIDISKQYFTQGTGPILEKYMPFENNTKSISEKDLPLDLSFKQVTSAKHIFPVYKEWVGNELICKDYNDKILSLQEIKKYQDSIKSAIKNYGGVDAIISFEDEGFNFSNGSYNTKQYNENWHAILLIGWDDGYSKDNFNEAVRPLSDGAYIALNSWGEDIGDNGYIYISYEELSMDSIDKTYIKEVEDVDYDNVYYNDLSLAKDKGEILTEVSIVTRSGVIGTIYADLKVDGKYVFQDILLDDCIENYVLDKPITLNENTRVELSISVQEQYMKYFSSYYYTVTNESQFESGELNKKVLDGNSDEIYLYTRHNTIDNGKSVEIKILKDEKDLTSEFNIEGNNIYSNQTGIVISPKQAYNGEYVMKLIYNNQEKFHTFSVINGIEYVGKEPEADDEEDKVPDNDKEEDKVPDIPSDTDVRGDISLDGKVTVTDLSQLKYYIDELIELKEQQKLICDLNEDGNISIVDLSILQMLIVGFEV